MSKKAELVAKRTALAAEIKKQADAYNDRRSKNETAWPDATKDAWDTVNREHDEVDAQIRQLDNDDAVAARVRQIVDSEGRSTRNGRQMPGLDDQAPGEDRTYGEMGLQDRDEAKLA